jgi:cysteine-rich repeat protein
MVITLTIQPEYSSAIRTVHFIVIITDVCGNGRRYGSSSDECDDGNHGNGDGCNERCELENGYVCQGGNIGGADVCKILREVGDEPTDPTPVPTSEPEPKDEPVCGNGVIEEGED